MIQMMDTFNMVIDTDGVVIRVVFVARARSKAIAVSVYIWA